MFGETIVIIQLDAARDMRRAFTARPTCLPGASIDALLRLQPLWNQLYDRVGRDHDFLRSVLGESASRCAWEARQLAVHGRVVERARSKPQLLLPNSVYLQRDEPGSAGGAHHWVHTQVTHSGPTLSTVAQPPALQRLHAPGVGLVQPPSPPQEPM